MLFANASQAQQQPPFSADEEKLILRALIDRDEAISKAKELAGQLRIADEQINLAAERLRIERDQRLSEKKLHLSALKAIAEYQIKQRPLIVKIFTFGIVRNKRNKLLEEQIANLEKEIIEWR